MTGDPEMTPAALLHNLKHNRVLHEKNVLLNVRSAPVPRVPDSERIAVERINDDFKQMVVTYGFMEQPNLPSALAKVRREGLKFDIMSTSFFLSRRALCRLADLWHAALAGPSLHLALPQRRHPRRLLPPPCRPRH